MQKERFSLMTFSMDADLALKQMTVTDCLTLAGNEGIPHVDVMDLSEPQIQRYLSAAKETGVTPLCYIGSVSFFSNSEAVIRDKLSHQLQTAARLGAKLYMIVPMNVLKDERFCSRMGKAQVRSRLKTYFSLAVQLAEGSGIRVCFETTPREYTCLSGAEDCRWLLEQVPGLGLVFDTANMLSHGDDPLAYYEALKDYIIHTHIKDVALSAAGWTAGLFCAERTHTGEVMKCCIFGEGVIPLKEILRRMERDGYQGTFALEYCHPKKYPAGFAAHAAQFKKHLAFFE